MEGGHENVLLTSSDYEHLMADLKGSQNDFSSLKLSPLLAEPAYTHVDENGEIMNPLQTHTNPPLPILQCYVGGQDVRNALVESTTLQDVSPPSMSPTGTIPCRDDYPGPLKFHIYLDSSTAHRKSWIYSHELHKVFIDMNKSLLVQFSVDQYIGGLRVRALPVYSTDDHVSVPVTRCIIHELTNDCQLEAHQDPYNCKCANFEWTRHVVQSSHSQAQYEYDSESDRHSVVVPLDAPQVGSDTSVVEYHFTCKTSCPRGMNRKPIDVIFTLETEQGDVIGRQLVSVKICSCPKRDKEKEEADAAMGKKSSNQPGHVKRRISSSGHQGSLKKLKTEDNSHEVERELLTSSEEAENKNHNALAMIEAAKNDSTVDVKYIKLVEMITNQISDFKNQIQQIEDLQNKIQQQNEDFQNKQNELCKMLEAKMDQMLNLIQM